MKTKKSSSASADMKNIVVKVHPIDRSVKKPSRPFGFKLDRPKFSKKIELPSPPKIKNWEVPDTKQHSTGAGTNSTKPAKPILNSDVLNAHLVKLPSLVYDVDFIIKTASALNVKSESEILMDIYYAKCKELFFQKVLVVGGRQCQICEVEYYQYPDPFMPIQPEFSTYGELCLNSDGNRVFISCGNPEYPGGILIRSIMIIDGDIFVEGSEKVADLIRGVESKLVDLDPNLRFTESKIYAGPRVGLTLKQESLDRNGRYLIYVMKPFRFTCQSSRTKSHRHYFALYAKYRGIPEDIINKDFKLNMGSLGKWTTLFINGQTSYYDYFLTDENSKLENSKVQIALFGFCSEIL